MLASRDVLFEMMDKEEAIEVMCLNPAVLQCGPSLELSGASEIKALARLRALGNQLLPSKEARVAALGVASSSCLGVTSSLANLTLSHAASFVLSTVFSAPPAAFTVSA